MSKEHPEFTLPDSVRIISYDEWVKELNTHEPTVKELQEENEQLKKYFYRLNYLLQSADLAEYVYCRIRVGDTKEQIIKFIDRVMNTGEI